jgi:hypothetical protein
MHNLHETGFGGGFYIPRGMHVDRSQHCFAYVSIPGRVFHGILLLSLISA